MAITSVYQRPNNMSAAYNPIIWSFESDKNEEPDMKYVIDIYVNGATGPSHRIKQRPNPSGVCMIDISNIAQNYISLANYDAPKGSFADEYFDYEGVTVYLEAKAGEEYNVSGVPTIFDGSGSEGEPAYDLKSIENQSNSSIYSSPGIVATPAALDWNLYNFNTSDQGLLGGEYWIQYAPVPGNSNYANFLTRNPGSNKMARYNPDASVNQNYADPLWVSFWNLRGVSWGSSNTLQQISDVFVEYYEEDGTLIASQAFENRTGQGGGPTNSYPPPVGPITFSSTAVDTYFLNFNLSSIWHSYTQSSASPTCAYFLAYLRQWDGAYYQKSSNPVRVDLVDYCENELYDRIRLGWLNDLGGWDFYNFTKYYEKTTESTAETWDQAKINWSGITSYDSTTNQPVYRNLNALRGGTKVYNKNTTVKYRTESDWVTQEEVDFLGGISESPLVYAWVQLNGLANSTDLESQYTYSWYPLQCTVDNLSYSYKNIKQQKLVQVSFDITINKPNKKQNIV